MDVQSKRLICDEWGGKGRGSGEGQAQLGQAGPGHQLGPIARKNFYNANVIGSGKKEGDLNAPELE